MSFRWPCVIHHHIPPEHRPMDPWVLSVSFDGTPGVSQFGIKSRNGTGLCSGTVFGTIRFTVFMGILSSRNTLWFSFVTDLPHNNNNTKLVFCQYEYSRIVSIVSWSDLNMLNQYDEVWVQYKCTLLSLQSSDLQVHYLQYLLTCLMSVGSVLCRVGRREL